MMTNQTKGFQTQIQHRYQLLQFKIHQYHNNLTHQTYNQNYLKHKKHSQYQTSNHNKRFKNYYQKIRHIYNKETPKLPNPEPETVTPTTIPQPTLTHTEKQTLSRTQQESYLYWKGLIDVRGGVKKKRYRRKIRKIL